MVVHVGMITYPDADPRVLTDATEGYSPSTKEEYADFTQDAALLLKNFIYNSRFPESTCKKRCWQLRCIGESDDLEDERLRILIVNGATSFFALTKYIAEAFAWTPTTTSKGCTGRFYHAQPSKGVVPAGSHWLVNRFDERYGTAPNKKMTGIVGSKNAVFKAAGNGAPFFPEKRVKVFQLFTTRGDTMIYRSSEGGRKVTVRLDGVTCRDGRDNPRYTPRCVGADSSSLPTRTWTDLNAKYLQNLRGEPMLMSSSLTEEEMDEVIANTYKGPLFDNRGNSLNQNYGFEEIAEMHRVVALPFREEPDNDSG